MSRPQALAAACHSRRGCRDSTPSSGSPTACASLGWGPSTPRRIPPPAQHPALLPGCVQARPPPAAPGGPGPPAFPHVARAVRALGCSDRLSSRQCNASMFQMQRVVFTPLKQASAAQQKTSGRATPRGTRPWPAQHGRQRKARRPRHVARGVHITARRTRRAGNALQQFHRFVSARWRCRPPARARSVAGLGGAGRGAGLQALLVLGPGREKVRLVKVHLLALELGLCMGA